MMDPLEELLTMDQATLDPEAAADQVTDPADTAKEVDTDPTEAEAVVAAVETTWA